MANMNYEVQVIYFQRSRPKKITFCAKTLCWNLMFSLVKNTIYRKELKPQTQLEIVS